MTIKDKYDFNIFLKLFPFWNNNQNIQISYPATIDKFDVWPTRE